MATPSAPALGRVLAVPEIADETREALVRAGFELEQAADAAGGGPAPDVLLLEVPASEAARGVRAARARWPGAGLVVITSSESAALEAMTAGADRALEAGQPVERIRFAVARAAETARLRARVVTSAPTVVPPEYPGLIGQHPVMQELLQKVAQVAPRRATVLLFGESGTGKEVVARALHGASARASGPFVAVNCAALSETLLESELFGHERGAFTGAGERREGRFARAHGGTLFLDEVSEVPLSLQVKLLRFLQEREFEPVGSDVAVKVDVRIVAASNRDLEQRVKEGAFREDLYYRLNVVRIDVPPLRARPSDIILLADHFLRHFAEEEDVDREGLTEAARRALLAYPWPGNVRELKNAMERAVILAQGPWIEPEDLPFGASAPAAAEDAVRLMVPGVTLAELERYAILRTLESVGGSTQRAAKILGVSRRKIQYRLKEWDIIPPLGPELD